MVGETPGGLSLTKAALEYALEVPLNRKERKARLLGPEVARLLVGAPRERAVSRGSFTLPDVLIQVLETACSGPQGIFAQPALSHLSESAYRPDLDRLAIPHSMFATTREAGAPSVLTARCTDARTLMRLMDVLRCETIVLFPARAAWPEDDLLAAVVSGIDDTRVAAAYMKCANRYPGFGFVSSGHENLEFLGVREGILGILEAITRAYG